MDIKELALNRAIGMLKGAGVGFVIVTEDGKVTTSANTAYVVRHTNVIYRSDDAPDAKRASPSKPRRDWKHIGYVEQLSKLQAGEVWIYSAKDAAEATAIQKSVTSTAHRLWGSGNYMTSTSCEKLEVLRLV